MAKKKSVEKSVDEVIEEVELKEESESRKNYHKFLKDHPNHLPVMGEHEKY